MIGNYIKGTGTDGKPCEGEILDKVRTVITLGMKTNGTLGQVQQIPMPLDAYLVLSPAGTMHLVQPQYITDIGFPAGSEKIPTNNVAAQA